MTKPLEPIEVSKCLKGAAYVFGHPRSNFGIFLMGVTAGAAIATFGEKVPNPVSHDDSLPSLMTLFSLYEKMCRDAELGVNIDVIEQMTIEAERKVEEYHKSKR